MLPEKDNSDFENEIVFFMEVTCFIIRHARKG
jgi:hypothetical protein